jgi:hypothetical protein
MQASKAISHEGMGKGILFSVSWVRSTECLGRSARVGYSSLLQGRSLQGRFAMAIIFCANVYQLQEGPWAK